MAAATRTSSPSPAEAGTRLAGHAGAGAGRLGSGTEDAGAPGAGAGEASACPPEGPVGGARKRASVSSAGDETVAPGSEPGSTASTGEGANQRTSRKART